MEGKIIQMFMKPLNRERFEQKEEARDISIKQRHCDHHLEIDDDLDDHNCNKCGKLFSSHDALLYIVHNNSAETSVRISSYNLRNEINFLTEKRDKLKDDIKHLQSEKRKIKKDLLCG